MVCEKCGKKVAGDAEVCEACKDITTGKNPKKRFVKLLLLIIAVIVIAVGTVVALKYSGVIKTAPERAFIKYIEAVASRDSETVYSLTVDPYTLNEHLDFDQYKDENEVEKYYKECTESIYGDLKEKYGSNLKTDIKIKNVTRYKKEKVKELAANFENGWDYDKGALQDVVIVNASVVYKGDVSGGSEVIEEVIVKIKDKWYVSPGVLYENHAAIKSTLRTE